MHELGAVGAEHAQQRHCAKQRHFRVDAVELLAIVHDVARHPVGDAALTGERVPDMVAGWGRRVGQQPWGLWRLRHLGCRQWVLPA